MAWTKPMEEHLAGSDPERGTELCVCWPREKFLLDGFGSEIPGTPKIPGCLKEKKRPTCGPACFFSSFDP